MPKSRPSAVRTSFRKCGPWSETHISGAENVRTHEASVTVVCVELAALLGESHQ